MIPLLSFQAIENGVGVNHALAELDDQILRGTTLNLSMSDIKTIRFTEKLDCCDRILLHLNQISVFPKSVFQSSIANNLIELNLSRNQLRIIPNEISTLVNLKELYLDSNRIENLPQSLGDCDSLQILDISYNLLRSIPIEIVKLKKLGTIFASFKSFNVLDTKPSKAIKRLSLRELSFQASALLIQDVDTNRIANKLKYIPDHILSDLCRLAPYKCSACKTLLWIPMKEYSLVNLNQTPLIVESLYCSPLHFKSDKIFR